MNEEQEIENYEIDLIDLMFYFLEKWRFIVVSMLIFALILGGNKYRVTVKENQAKQRELYRLEEEKKKKEDILDKEEVQYVEEKNDEEADPRTVKSYENAIEKGQSILQRQEDYLENSIIMKLDPYHISEGTLSYYLDGGEYIDTLLSAYQTYIADGRIAKELNSLNPEISVEDLRYLISFTNSANRVFEFGNNQTIQTVRPGEIVFQIQIKMPNSNLCDLYLRQAEKSIADYANSLQSEVVKHELVFLASTQAEITDLDIEKYQLSLQSAYMASVKNLQTLKSELDSFVYTENEEDLKKEKDAEIKEEISVEQQEIVLEDPRSFAMKSMIVGLLSGLFLSCLVLALFYIFGGKLQNTKNFKQEYGIPVLGFIFVSRNKRKLFGFVDVWISHLRAGIYTKIEYDEQIKMVIANIQTAINAISYQKEVKRIMLAGTIQEDLEEIIIRLCSEIKGISLSSYKKIVFHSLALREVEEYDAVLFLEKKGASQTELIIQERNLVLARNVNILGAVILSDFTN